MTEFLHSRNFAIIALVMALVAVPVACGLDATIAVNLLLTLSVAVGCAVINKGFNIMRAQTDLWVAFFLIMQAAAPALFPLGFGGCLASCLLLVVIALMFSCFGERGSTRTVFLMFFLLAVAGFFRFALLFYLPVLLFGLAQMRVLTLKSVLAAVMGLTTPAWIVFGCRLMSPGDVTIVNEDAFFLLWPEIEGVQTLGVVTFSAVAGLVALGANLMKVISYTAKFRSFNGFLAVMLLATIILMAADYSNLALFVPTLNFLAAYQIAHAFSNQRTSRSYIGILSIIAIYAAAYSLIFWL